MAAVTNDDIFGGDCVMIGGTDQSVPVIADNLKRKRQDSSLGKDQLAGVVGLQTTGVLFLASLKDKKLILVSSENYFNGMKSRNVQVDGGCSSLVIAVESTEHLRQIFEMYADDGIYNLRIVQCGGITGISYVLSVSLYNFKMLSVELCADLIPTSKQSAILVDSLQYAISREDIELIVQDENLSKILSAVAIKALQAYVDSTSASLSTRLEYTLIGQAVLNRVSTIKFRHIEYYVNPQLFMPDMWKTMAQQEKILSEALSLCPGLLQQATSACAVADAITVKFFDEL